ncbi:MAG TPA: lipoyl synthase [Syntrophomonas sp.]|nr:lipoyl synthase [Syntrophomonas sp.]
MLNRPDWLTLKAPDPVALGKMKTLLEAGRLHTVCEGADCPNIGECFASKTCTFMIMGDICTRNCRFCAVAPGRPAPLDPGEPQAVALTTRQLGLKHVVVTSVTRDDLEDGGAAQFAAVIKAIRTDNPGTSIEVLIPDFKGNAEALAIVAAAGPDVINHNVETVPRLYPEVRPQAVYSRSLEVLGNVKGRGHDILSKSGLMLGLGETRAEVVAVMKDLRAVGCDMLTLGQYLSPSPAHHPIVEYVHPDTFALLERIAFDLGFLEVNAGPLVRSSYHAARTIDKINLKKIELGGTNHGKSGQI